MKCQFIDLLLVHIGDVLLETANVPSYHWIHFVPSYHWIHFVCASTTLLSRVVRVSGWIDLSCLHLTHEFWLAIHFCLGIIVVMMFALPILVYPQQWFVVVFARRSLIWGLLNTKGLDYLGIGGLSIVLMEEYCLELLSKRGLSLVFPTSAF